jgi:UPF0042 nucleotide-binding protein
LPSYRREGKSYLTIAFGCTGGRHRSVLIAERFAEQLRDAGWPVTLQHRDTPLADPHNDRPQSRAFGREGP